MIGLTKRKLRTQIFVPIIHQDVILSGLFKELQCEIINKRN